jgi:hypothetical protein
MIRLYIDGVLIAETADTTTGSTVSTAPLQMGWRYDYARRLNGAIGDVRLYDRALTPSEVASMYYDKWALYRSPEPVLAGAPAAAGGFFEFDQLTGGMPDLRGGMV